ncbi:hypothetical protein ACFVY0_40380 [Streptomyces sp. NPDC058286]|uniref:hypothetical protein n=1 Tax=Streptomyces sp. NPDC058286 TaxID=3346422 RepID=UPI0036EB41B2
MAAPTRTTTPAREAGDTWLANCARRPELAFEVWDMDGLAPIHCTHWLAAQAQLSVSLQALRRIPQRHRGPLLLDPDLDTAWWLVAPDAGEELADVRLLTVHPAGWPLHCPPARRPAAGRFWFHAPDGRGRLTDPVHLASALGPGGPRILAEAFG